MHQLMNRVKTVAGHVRGVQRMVEADAYCIDLIKQTQAIQRALDRASSLVLEEHLNEAVTSTLRDAPMPERERVITELLAVFHGFQQPVPDLPAPGPDTDRTLQRLDWLAQVEQQVGDVQQMLETSIYPIQIISQIDRVQRMLGAFQQRVLADHLNGCVTTAIRSQRSEERERVVSELLQVFDTTRQLS